MEKEKENRARAEEDKSFIASKPTINGKKEMTKIVRVGVTFPPNLLKELDETIEKMGYDSRSKAVQDAVRSFLTEYRRLQKQKGTSAGVLVIAYDHKVTGLKNALIETQHKLSHMIYSSLHIHLSERECLEAIAVKGDADEIRKLVHGLTTKKGVKQVRLTLVSS
ncbi:MAG: nickel-responsive transcriptional regulator NikR [Candidatus Bathyarchaeota archaeon]|nr:MAG: nickel-responsive transcriptional regulator NikR [Candidatus Bathyarchaeota archaeon]